MDECEPLGRGGVTGGGARGGGGGGRRDGRRAVPRVAGGGCGCAQASHTLQHIVAAVAATGKYDLGKGRAGPAARHRVSWLLKVETYQGGDL